MLVIDITERKKAEEALKTSEMQFRQLFLTLPVVSRFMRRSMMEKILFSEISMPKAEDELSGKEKRFRAIFDKSFQFTLVLDTNGIVLEMNELCYTVHGPLAEASLGKPFWKAAWWSQFPEVAEKTKLAIQNCQVGKIVHDEVEFIDKDFQIHYGIRIFSPIADENGKLLYISVVGLDISETKES